MPQGWDTFANPSSNTCSALVNPPQGDGVYPPSAATMEADNACKNYDKAECASRSSQLAFDFYESRGMPVGDGGIDPCSPAAYTVGCVWESGDGGGHCTIPRNPDGSPVVSGWVLSAKCPRCSCESGQPPTTLQQLRAEECQAAP